MPVDSIPTIASPGSSMAGSGTVSTRTSRFPCHATARIFAPPVRAPERRLWTRWARSHYHWTQTAPSSAGLQDLTNLDRKLGQDVIQLAGGDTALQQPSGRVGCL